MSFQSKKKKNVETESIKDEDSISNASLKKNKPINGESLDINP